MKKLILLLTFLTNISLADTTASIGWASEYHYRGIFQNSSSANAGLNYEDDNIYAGTWLADVGDGLEVDTYFGYTDNLNDLNYNIGFTGYYYTSDFDDTYQELNLNLEYKILAVDTAFGKYNNFKGNTQDYVFYSVKLEKNNLYAKYGAFERDFNDNYIELGYNLSLDSFDLGFILVFNDDESAIFTIGKTFDL